MSKWLVEVLEEDTERPSFTECEDEKEADKVFEAMSKAYPTATITKRPNTRKILTEY